MMDTHEPVLEAREISKTFPGVRALDNVGFSLHKGRLTALLGENGAGKSTLMNIVAGVFPQDEGQIYLEGEAVRFSNPREARDAGIAMIFQELNLVANLSVAENIFLGREPLNKLGLIDQAKMARETKVLLEKLDLAVDPATPLGTLRVGQQQIVEIAKALSSNARVLIMDEPTSAITQHEVEVLFGIIKKLKQQGVAIAYITHKLDELTRIGDDAVVMRDGKVISAASLQSLNREEIVAMMVGREMKEKLRADDSHKAAGKAQQKAQQVLRVENLSLSQPGREDFLLHNISFDVHRGEVLGIFGLMGAGRTELLEALFGLHPSNTSGNVFIDNMPVAIKSPAQAISLGFALAPEDRKRDGLIPGMSVAENASLACLSRFGAWGFIDRVSEQQMAEHTVARFRVKTTGIGQIIRNLSGGNQQKVIFGKWLATEPAILLLDEPTRGIDVNAKAEIYALIRELSESGLAVIVVSSELHEIFALSDRIMVLCEGRKTAEFAHAVATEETIMQAALPREVAVC